jgi:hypothetical protein
MASVDVILQDYNFCSMENKRKFMGITVTQNSQNNYFPIFLNHVIEKNG